MAKKKLSENAFFCQSCGHCEKKWYGKCPACHEWNTMVEEKFSAKETKAQTLSQDSPECIISVNLASHPRLKTQIDELDRVLGGGLVLGSVVLVGGEPGTGKSTLLQMASARLAKNGHKVLYISAEESKQQIRLSAERLDALSDNLFLLSQTNINAALKSAKELAPDFLVVDSVQTVLSEDFDSSAGSVTQIKEVTDLVVKFAKSSGIPTFLVGHVTKDGNIAGPRLLEHMVDTVLYFEHSKNDHYRILRAHKNRFGSTNEIGLFEMGSSGLVSIKNPSAFFLAQRNENKPGTCVFCSIEGTRPLLVEIQALVVDTLFGNPRRTCVGVDSNRVSVVAAILEKHANINLSKMDLFISVAGGIDIKDPAIDLALALAIASSIKNVSLPKELICLGELGLCGEIRSVFRLSDRLKESERLGFTKAIIPQMPESFEGNNLGLKIKQLKNIHEAVRLVCL